MTRVLAEQRALVCAYARRMVADRLVVGTSGNVSVRAGDLVAVTPTGVDYAELTPDSITVLDLAGDVVSGEFAPTSETPMHLAIYRGDTGMPGKPVAAIVHTHAVHATAVSTVVSEVPPIHYQVAIFGGSVRVAPYATYGTPELAEVAVRALHGRAGCLLANHGAVTVGGTLAAAYDRAVQLEWLCQVWLAARAVGEPALLDATEVAKLTVTMSGYGAAARESGG
jgi:L-fuculose-phosphate aldolase